MPAAPPTGPAPPPHEAGQPVIEAGDAGQFPVLDRFSLSARISRDTHGTCYLGRELATGRLLRIRLYNASSESARRGFARALIPCALSHQAIEEVVEFGASGSTLFIATDGADRRSVRQLMGEGRAERHPLDVRTSLEVAVGLWEALSVIHLWGLFHRNIKSDHVIVSTSGTVSLSGFDLCTLLPAGYSDPSSAGTLPYMAPEAIGGCADHRADHYSAAVVLYEMLVGKPPFKAKTAEELTARILDDPPVPPADVNPGVPAAVSEAVLRGLEKDPDRRSLGLEDLRGLLSVTLEPEAVEHE
jgi:eukaryotic-like serine/threonine-protein kinase